MALLIAFIISIPLELLIFQENIELHMEKYKLDQTYAVQQASLRNEDISSKEKIRKRDSINASILKSELAFGEPQGDPNYDNLKTDLEEKNSKYRSLLSSFNSADLESTKALNNVPTKYNPTTKEYERDKQSSEWNTYQKKVRIKTNKRDELNRFKTILNKAKSDLKSYKSNWITKMNTDKNNLDNRITSQENEIAVSTKKADSITDVFGDNIKDKKGFVLRFMILEDLASTKRKVRKQIQTENTNNSSESPLVVDSVSVTKVSPIKVNETPKTKWVEEYEYNSEGATILFLLWLIRILFFTIEILPTIAKIATPLGAYDFAIYRKEREIQEDLEKRTEDYIKHQKEIRELENLAHQEQIISKNKIENELHQDILKEIASAQNDVAKKQIEDFRKKHL